MLTSIALVSCFLASVGCVHFSIEPSTFIPGVTPSVSMKCAVSDSGQELSQLLLIQVEIMHHGSMVPLVTFTPGTTPRVTAEGQAAHAQVEGSEFQFHNISASYVSVTYPFPKDPVAGNYSCVVSGLSTDSLLVRYTVDDSLTLGAIDSLPGFMTTHVADIRAQIEHVKQQSQTLLSEALSLRDLERNASAELSLLEQEYISLTNEVVDLKHNASQLKVILTKPTSDLDRLANVRPEMKVAFHAAVSDLGAKTAALNEPLVFDHVVINEGQAYNPRTGVFKAPVTGTYLLSVSVEAGSGNRNSELSIMTGDRILQTMHMSDDRTYQQSTTSALVNLQAQSEVTCEFTWLDGLPGYVGSTEVDAPYVTAFSGYILW